MRPIAVTALVTIAAKLAFELLTGKPPFTKHGVQALIVAHVVEAPPIARSFCHCSS